MVAFGATVVFLARIWHKNVSLAIIDEYIPNPAGIMDKIPFRECSANSKKWGWYPWLWQGNELFVGVPRCLWVCMTYILPQMWNTSAKMRRFTHIWETIHTLSKNHRNIHPTNNSRISHARVPSQKVHYFFKKSYLLSGCTKVRLSVLRFVVWNRMGKFYRKTCVNAGSCHHFIFKYLPAFT